MSRIQDIKNDGYQVGDGIRIQCALGIKEGIIMEFCDDRIRLRPLEAGKKPISISEASIVGDWEEIDVPEQSNNVTLAQPHQNVTQPANQLSEDKVELQQNKIAFAEVNSPSVDNSNTADVPLPQEVVSETVSDQKASEKEQLKRLKKEAIQTLV